MINYEILGMVLLSLPELLRFVDRYIDTDISEDTAGFVFKVF
jgi:hypothetical protein